MIFEIAATDGQARRGQLHCARGVVDTPAFMPVGTYGTVKAMTAEELEQVGAQIVLGNTFHLMLRPGQRADRARWAACTASCTGSGPILTDSGGFQVFSLGGTAQIREDGVEFSSPTQRRPRVPHARAFHAGAGAISAAISR